MKKFSSKIFDLIKESRGDFSSMRLICVIGVGLILMVWVTMCFKTGQVLDFPWGCVSVIGIFVTGKVLQKSMEALPVEPIKVEQVENDPSK